MKAKYVPYETDLCRKRLICAVEGEYDCHERRICVVEGDLVRKRWICAAKGDLVPCEVDIVL